MSDVDRKRFASLQADLSVVRYLAANKLSPALKTAELNAKQAIRQLPAGDPVKLCCCMTLVALSGHGGDPAAARDSFLTAAGELLSQQTVNTLESNVAQQLILHRVWGPIAQGAAQSVDAGANFAELEGKLETELTAAMQQLRQKGVPQEICSFGWLVLAQLQANSQRFDHCLTTLAKVEPHVSLQHVLPGLRADYWTLQGLLETNLYLFHAARNSHEQALAIRRENGLAPQLVAQSLNNLGYLLLRQGDIEGAFRNIESACDLYGKLPIQTVDAEQYSQSLANLAKVYEAKRDYDNAAITHLRAVKTAQKSPSPVDDVLCENNLALFKLQIGDIDAAESILARLRTTLTGLFGAAHLRVAECAVNQGWVAYSKGEANAAAAYFEEATVLLEKIVPAYHPRLAEARSYWARVLVRLDQPQVAARQVVLAIEGQRIFLDNILASAISERDRLALVQELRLHHEASNWPGLLETIYELADALALPVEKQYQILLYWKGIVDRHSVRLEVEKLDDAGKEIFAKRSVVLDQLRATFFTQPEPERALLHQERILELQAEANRLQRLLLASAEPENGAQAAMEPSALAQVLQEDEVFVDFFQYWPLHQGKDGYLTRDSRYLAFVIRRDQPIVKVDLGDADPIDKAVIGIFQSLSPTSKGPQQHAERLGELLRTPLAPHVGGAGSIIFCGDGYLHRVPVAMLPGGKPGTVWLDEAAFSWTATAGAFVVRRQHQPRENKSAGALIVAGVDYGDLSDGVLISPDRQADGTTLLGRLWEKLPGTQKEGEAVEKLLAAHAPEQPLKMLTGKEATEEAVVNLLPSSRYVHLATHGFFDFQQFENDVFTTYDVSAGFDSALLFSMVNYRQSDGKADQVLTAQEFARLDLHNVELLVMAACSTGMGHVRAGQGVVGLLGALEESGVHANVSALWPVGDDATFHLMRQFYGYYFDPAHHLNVAQALRAAQLDLLRGRVKNAKNEEMNHALFWAPFVVSGDPSTAASR